MNNNNNSSSNTTNNNNNNKASKKWRSIDEMERAFERAEKGLKFAMANGYHEEMERNGRLVLVASPPIRRVNHVILVERLVSCLT